MNIVNFEGFCNFIDGGLNGLVILERWIFFIVLGERYRYLWDFNCVIIGIKMDNEFVLCFMVLSWF